MKVENLVCCGRFAATALLGRVVCQRRLVYRFVRLAMSPIEKAASRPSVKWPYLPTSTEAVTAGGGAVLFDAVARLWTTDVPDWPPFVIWALLAVWLARQRNRR